MTYRLDTPQRMDEHLWRMFGKAVTGTERKKPQRDKRLKNVYWRMMELRDKARNQ